MTQLRIKKHDAQSKIIIFTPDIQHQTCVCPLRLKLCISLHKILLTL